MYCHSYWHTVDHKRRIHWVKPTNSGTPSLNKNRHGECCVKNCTR
jgi:hypothetical protein